MSTPRAAIRNPYYRPRVRKSNLKPAKMNDQEHQCQKEMVRHELFLRLRKFFVDFKSTEAPHYELTAQDRTFVMSRYINSLSK